MDGNNLYLWCVGQVNEGQTYYRKHNIPNRAACFSKGLRILVRPPPLAYFFHSPGLFCLFLLAPPKTKDVLWMQDQRHWI